MTNDRNRGSILGGTILPPPEQFALGATISRRVGPIDVQVMYTHDVYARSTLKGGKIWFNLGYKIF